MVTGSVPNLGRKADYRRECCPAKEVDVFPHPPFTETVAIIFTWDLPRLKFYRVFRFSKAPEMRFRLLVVRQWHL